MILSEKEKWIFKSLQLIWIDGRIRYWFLGSLIESNNQWNGITRRLKRRMRDASKPGQKAGWVRENKQSMSQFQKLESNKNLLKVWEYK